MWSSGAMQPLATLGGKFTARINAFDKKARGFLPAARCDRRWVELCTMPITATLGWILVIGRGELPPVDCTANGQ
ncbi:hypothetical protein CEQ31_020820 [Serratia odorifera]|uniref:Uncharacterized protein n=1 Tax=Serratia odorifera DSM 4582 TaxID=667129 RepID=D4DXT5_SEROD|nr:hypothetical protein HMPREF0758_0908 [Serratia odorifera DSM 4582]PNK91941.1 hypothetical protein CEQ31_020820 [Serratia odorifera]RII73220.1 hypothetical protein DX901_05665 [Serratia odorifera]